MRPTNRGVSATWKDSRYAFLSGHNADMPLLHAHVEEAGRIIFRVSVVKGCHAEPPRWCKIGSAAHGRKRARRLGKWIMTVSSKLCAMSYSGFRRDTSHLLGHFE